MMIIMDYLSSRRQIGKFMLKFPYPLIVSAIYVFIGMTFHIWHPLWLIFLTIPIYYHFAGACRAKGKKAYLLSLPVPEVIVFTYLILGFFFHLWGTTWWIFLIIPTYYWIIAAYVKNILATFWDEGYFSIAACITKNILAAL